MIKSKDENDLIVALDVGTSKIVVIVAELLPDGVLKIIGLGQHVSKRIKKGCGCQYRKYYASNSKSC